MSTQPPVLKLRRMTFDWSRPIVAGIVNVTPDSFSDGGQFSNAKAAINHGLKLIDQGADWLDVGGESTRPRGATYGAGAVTVPDAEEIARVVPVIRGLRAATEVPISIDTRKSAVARAALDAGADMVNDVSGLLHDCALGEVVRAAGAALVLMHTPRDMEQLTHEEHSSDIVADVITGLSAALDRADGVARDRILLDPGIGFGKSAAANLYLLGNLEPICVLGYPVMVGASRKASIARVAAGQGGVPDPAKRLGASIGAALMAWLAGAQVLRVHDVLETVQALRVAAAIREA